MSPLPLNGDESMALGHRRSLRSSSSVFVQKQERVVERRHSPRSTNHVLYFDDDKAESEEEGEGVNPMSNSILLQQEPPTSVGYSNIDNNNLDNDKLSGFPGDSDETKNQTPPSSEQSEVVVPRIVPRRSPRTKLIPRSVDYNVDYKRLSWFPCSMCNAVPLSLHSLIEHYYTHVPKKQSSCSTCGKTFSSKAALHMHIKIRHAKKSSLSGEKKIAQTGDWVQTLTKESVYTCACGEKLLDLYSYLEHTKAHNKSDSPIDRKKLWRCAECEKWFCSVSELESHINSSHTEYKPFKCNKCEKGFISARSLGNHSRVHFLGERNRRRHSCLDCGSSYT